MSRQLWAVTLVLFCIAGFTGMANADSTQSWDLIGTNDPGQLPCSSGAPCAEVTIDVSGNHATFTVTSLLNGWVFDKFGFNTLAGVNVSLVSAGGEVGSYSLSGSGNEDGWGSFGHNFNTGKAGGSSGGDCASHGPGCSFTFMLSSTSALTLADFEKTTTGGNGSGFFAGHMASSSKSGYAGDSQLVTPVPEPVTMAILMPGLLVGGGFLRRRVLL